MYNKIIVMGRIVNDPELKATPSGVNVCQFRVAVDRQYQNKGEEKQTDFFNVTAWRKTAEFVTKYFGKGRLILIEGEMQTRPYTDKSGQKATWYEIVADRVSFTGEKSERSEAAPAGAPPVPTEQTATDDEYPF